MQIPFSRIPGYNQIFVDYIYNFNNLKSFYNYSYKSDTDFIRAIQEKQNSYLKNAEFDRNTIADILKIQNKFFNSRDRAIQNIALLKNENTFAIVTGQQAGLLTGNFYSVIKAIDAINLSKALNLKFPEFNFIPVYWIEADDHDFLEVNNINILTKENKLLNIEWLEGGQKQDKYLKPSYTIVFDEYINNFREAIKKNLQQTDFKDILIENIEKVTRQGLNLPTSFARFLNFLLDDSGLVFFDSTDPEIKKLLIPVFLKELNSFPETCEKVIETTAILEQEYPPQVKPKAINLFYKHNGNRYAIEPHPEKISGLKNSRQKFSADELFSLLYSNPDNFSPNVILRPICQDFLLPTIAYIGGPSEIAYFAQIKKVYNFYGIDMPVIYPRTNITIIENRVNNFLVKYGIKPEELFDERKVSTKLISKINEVSIFKIFENFKDELNANTYSICNDIRKIDKNLETLFKNKVSKFLDSLDSVRKKLEDTQLKQNDTTIEKLRSIINSIYPESVLQERYFNVIYFFNKYGPDFCEFLLKNIPTGEEGHHIIYIDFSGQIK